MSLNQIKIPAVLLTNSPAEIIYEKTGILTDVSDYSYLIMAFNQFYPPAAGDMLKLDFGDLTSIVFTFYDSPTDDATELPDFSGGDFNAYGANLALNIYAHPHIAQNYTVDYLGFDDGGSGDIIIKITARNRGVIGNIIIDGTSTVIVDNKGFLVNSLNDVPLSDYALNANVIIRMGGDSNLRDILVSNLQAIGKIDADANKAIIIFHDIPSICKSYLGVDIPRDIYNAKAADKSAAMVKLEISEVYDTGFQIGSDGATTNSSVYKKMQFPANSAPILCLAGGMPLNKFAYAENLLAWLANGTAGTSFLSLQPGRKKIIDINQPEWLSFVIPQFPFTAGLQFTIYYADGSTDTPYFSLPNTVGPVCIVPTGVPQFTFWSSTNIAYYTVQLFVGSLGYYGEIFTYVIDPRYFRDTRYFIYQNSLGQIDTLRCVGTNKFSLQKKQQVSERALQSTDRSERGSLEMQYNEIEQVWTMRTGWLLSRDEKEFLIDFLSSTYVAEVVMPLIPSREVTKAPTASIQPYRSCIVLQDSVEMWQHDDFTWGLEWKMKYANPETNYSNIAAVPDDLWDTFIEFDFTPGALYTDNLNFSIPDDYVIEINGVAYANLTTWPYTAGSATMHFKIMAQNVSYLSIGAATDSTICFTKLIIPAVTVLQIAQFGHIVDDYLLKRLPYLPKLQFIMMWSLMDTGAQADRRLAACAELFNNFGVLNEIDFGFYTPTAVGYAIKGALMNQGLSVATM